MASSTQGSPNLPRHQWEPSETKHPRHYLQFTETDLVDLHTSRHPNQTQPPTYNCGTTPIDFCTGSIKFIHALDRAWYLPFRLPAGLKGDHCTLGLDFNMEKLFNQQVAPMHKVPSQGVHSNDMKLVNSSDYWVSKPKHLQMHLQSHCQGNTHTQQPWNLRHPWHRSHQDTHQCRSQMCKSQRFPMVTPTAYHISGASLLVLKTKSEQNWKKLPTGIQ